MVQVSNLGSDCCGERDVGGRAGRNLRQGHPLTPHPVPSLGSCISAALALGPCWVSSRPCPCLAMHLIDPNPNPAPWAGFLTQTCLITMGFEDWDSGLTLASMPSLPSSLAGAMGRVLPCRTPWGFPGAPSPWPQGTTGPCSAPMLGACDHL